MTERRVWKFPLQLNDDIAVTMPAGAELLTVQWQGDQACLWALCEPTAVRVHRRFRLAGTGHPIIGDVAYVGTFQMAGGALVFHLFEVI